MGVGAKSRGPEVLPTVWLWPSQTAENGGAASGLQQNNNSGLRLGFVVQGLLAWLTVKFLVGSGVGQLKSW